MPDDIADQEEVETPPQPAGDPSANEKAPDFEADAKKWKAIALKHEAKVKELEPKARKAEEFETQHLSETEKLQKALDEAQASAKASTIKALKLEVANEKGLPASLAKFLPDVDNEVDMMQAADDLLEAAGSTAEPPTKRPKSPLNSPLGRDTDPDDDRERMLASMLGRPTP